MKQLGFYISIVALLCSLHSCNFSLGDDADDDANDSLDVDSLGLEKLDLYEEAVIPESADELFDDFLYSYISNPKFNDERTIGGLEALDVNEEESFVVIYEREEDLELQKDTALTKVQMEKVVWDEEGLVRYEFDRSGGKWYLADVQNDDLSSTPNAGFYVFLHDFMTDSLYRSESVQIPLPVHFYSEEDDNTEHVSLGHEEWNEMYADLPALTDYMININYGQTLISSNRKSLLLKGLSNGLLIKFHFVFSDGRWMLTEVEA